MDANGGRFEVMVRRVFRNGAQAGQETISRKLEESEAAFGVIEHYIQSGRLSSSDRECLAKITTDEP